MRSRILQVALTFGLVVLAGCAPKQAAIRDWRAIWVTRFDYKSEADVQRIIRNCADAGFNQVVFQVRGNANAFYDSKLEPWAVELGGKHPGWDPLAVAVRAARARKVGLHAWVNVMPAWRGTKPPANPEQLYNKRPEWFWYDQHGNRQALSDFYVSLNPCLPEVREYLVDVFEEIVARYDVDGLHLDYIRFPNEPPATPRGSGLDYPRDAKTLELYRAATGKSPDDDKSAWNRWRTEQVTQLITDIQAMVRRARPGAALTTAVGSIPSNALTHYQDGLGWRERGLVDAVVLMNYVDEPAEFSRRLDVWLEKPAPAALVPGPWFGRHPGKTPEQATEQVARQIAIARERAGNFCVFSYGSLFDSSDAGELAKQTTEQQRVREIRRRVLIPVIKGGPAPAAMPLAEAVAVRTVR